MPSESTELDLIALRADLERRYGVAPSYSQIWLAVANGRIPARRVGRIWQVNRADVPIIAAHFELTPAAPDAA
jgi:hypothetical protein